MQVYKAPLRDMRFVLHELHRGDQFEVPANEDFTPDLLDAVLEEAARFAETVLLPTNVSGDQEGCRLENGVVRTPASYVDAYNSFRDGGWSAMAGPMEWGGQGLPSTVHKLVEEIVSSANVSFSLFHGLTHGGVTAIASYAPDALKKRFLPKMVSGEWTGTMCLTEAHCGTDLGLLRTRASPSEDGTYRISGSKIFISGGDHDLTPNIIHLVLARLPDAPPGVKGISLFLVPKYVPAEDGSLGTANGVTTTALEHKMGIKGSPTCQLEFEESIGWLVGEPNRGMQAMFTMMNAERVSVGVQGLGIGVTAYQSAAAYARERLQGRSLGGPKRPDLPADPIIVHPDVRRMLMTMRAYTEGCRALGSWVSRALDAEKLAYDVEGRLAATRFVALMTPVVKALFTDLGFEAASLAVQTYGGHGYIREHGVEQLVRDARITMLYEGTNGVQALDLVGRKLTASDGALVATFFDPIDAFLASHGKEEALAGPVSQFRVAYEALKASTALITDRSASDAEAAVSGATDYLRAFGLVAIGYCFLRAIKIASERLSQGSDERAFYEPKLATARYFFDALLPQAQACLQAADAEKRWIMKIPEDWF